MTKSDRFEEGRDRIRARLCKFTKQAFGLLTPRDAPSILDVGCGSGVATMELARLTNGSIVSLDIDQHELDRLDAKIEKAGLSSRVRTVKRSMRDMDFPEESFDIIWAEGSIHVVGFESGLRQWARFLKPNGFLVVHDETGDVGKKVGEIAACGYDLVDCFALDQEIWWTEYCAPLQRLIEDMRPECAGDPQALALLDKNQREIDMFSPHSEHYHSTFFIMSKRQQGNSG